MNNKHDEVPHDGVKVNPGVVGAAIEPVKAGISGGASPELTNPAGSDEIPESYIAEAAPQSESLTRMRIRIGETTDSDHIFGKLIPRMIAEKGENQVYINQDTFLSTVDRNQATGKYEIKVCDSAAKISGLADRYAIFEVQENSKTKVKPLPSCWANILLYNPSWRRDIAAIKRVTQNPMLDVEGLKVLAPGYDCKSQMFYDGPVINPRTDGAIPHLDRLLSGFTGRCGSANRSCAEERDITHLYAAFMTEVLAESRLFNLHGHPLIRGNQKGVGKDKISGSLGILRDGDIPVDLQHTNSVRLHQAFSNGVMAGRRVFQFSNIADSEEFNSPMLCRWLTMESIQDAKHGEKGNWVLRENNVTLVANTNLGQIHYDLMDRFMPIDLVVSGKAKTRRFDFDPIDYMRLHRYEIIEEVMGLYLLCIKDRQTTELPVNTDKRFSKWLTVLSMMTERLGLRNFMLPDEDDRSVPCENMIFRRELLMRMNKRFGGKKVHAKDVVELCRNDGVVLFAEHLAAAQPAKQLARYELTPQINHPVNYETAGVSLTLNSCEDKVAKSTWFWVVSRPLETTAAPYVEAAPAQDIGEAASHSEGLSA